MYEYDTPFQKNASAPLLDQRNASAPLLEARQSTVLRQAQQASSLAEEPAIAMPYTFCTWQRVVSLWSAEGLVRRVFIPFAAILATLATPFTLLADLCIGLFGSVQP